MAAIRKLRSVHTPEPTTAPASAEAIPTYEPAPTGVVEVTTVGGVPTPTDTTTAAVAVIEKTSTEVTVPRAFAFDASAGLVGDWDQSDVKFPALKIVQGSGQLAAAWNTGTLLLGDDELLPPPDLRTPKPEHTFRFVPVQLTKQYRENLSQEEASSGAIPRIANSLAEVESMGGTTQWVGDQKPSWSPSARILMLVERPEGLPGSGTDHPGFVLEFGGRYYAPCVYYAGGSAWTAFAKPLFNAALTSLTVVERDENGSPVKSPTGVIRRVPYLPKAYWTWRTVRRPAGDYTVFAPEVRLTRDETSDELRSFVGTLLG